MRHDCARPALLVARCLLALIIAGCATTGKHVHLEVIDTPKGSPYVQSAVESTEQVAVLDAPASPLDLRVVTGNVVVSRTVQDFESATWYRRDWHWKLSPVKHWQVAGLLLLGGGLLATAAFVVDDLDNRGATALAGVGLASASSVPLGLLAVRTALVTDTIKDRALLTREQSVTREFTGVTSFSGPLVLTASGNGMVSGQIQVNAGEMSLASATIPYLHRPNEVTLTAEPDRPIRWEYSDIQAEEIYRRYGAALIAAPSVNKAFTKSYTLWRKQQAEADAKAEAERVRVAAQAAKAAAQQAKAQLEVDRQREAAKRNAEAEAYATWSRRNASATRSGCVVKETGTCDKGWFQADNHCALVQNRNSYDVTVEGCKLGRRDDNGQNWWFCRKETLCGGCQRTIDFYEVNERNYDFGLIVTCE